MRWRFYARVIGVLIAFITAAAGLLLIEPRLVAIGIAVPQGYEPVGALLLTSAVLSLICVATRVPRTFSETMLQRTFITAPLFAVGVIALILAWYGATAHRYWIVLLAIPAVGSFLSLLRDWLPLHAGVGAEQVGLTPESGRTLTMREGLLVGVRAVGVLLAYYSAGWIILVGIPVFGALKALLFTSVPWGWTQFLASLMAQRWVLWVAVFLLFYLCLVLVVVAGQRLRVLGVRDADRLLTLRELGFIERAFEETAEYADRAHYPERMLGMSFATMVAGLVLAAICLAAVFWATVAPLPVPPLPADVWFVASPDDGLSVGLLAGCSVLLFATGLPVAAIALFWRRYAERAGWRKLARSEGFAGVTRRLVLLARLHRLPEPFSAPRFLAREGRRISRGALALLLLAFGAIAAVAWYQTQIPVIGPTGIDLVDPWTAHRTHLDFGDVRSLELRCTIDKDGRRTVGIMLHLPWWRSVDLARGKYRIEGALLRIDRRLRHEGTPVHFAHDEHGRPLYDPACVRAEQKAGDPVATDVLHLDTWERRSHTLLQ